MTDARDDRFVAAFGIGSQYRPRRSASKPEPQPVFRLAYIARAVTTGTFRAACRRGEDMYAPDGPRPNRRGERDDRTVTEGSEPVLSRAKLTVAAFALFGVACALATADSANPPDMTRAHNVSPEVVDRHGVLLRAFLTPRRLLAHAHAGPRRQPALSRHAQGVRRQTLRRDMRASIRSALRARVSAISLTPDTSSRAVRR